MLENYHILALGGIGMSAIARLLRQQGHNVSGYDKNLDNFIDQLKKEGIKISNTFSHLTNYLVYSSAIAQDHPEIVKAKIKKVKLLHRSDMLAKIMNGKDAVLVAGSHGKTTVSGLLSHALTQIKLNPSFAIGGILNNYQTNAKLDKGKLFISEADESDGSFLKLPCTYAIITNLDDDHLDYWKTYENLSLAFQKFMEKPKKKLIWCIDDQNLRSLNPKGISYGFFKNADVLIYNYRTMRHGSIFSIKYLEQTLEDIFIPFFGRHQVLNASAVIAFFLINKLDTNTLLSSFQSYTGIKRRQELVGCHNNVDIYHDYAHHPTEIYAILESFRKQIEEKRLVVVFQPHRFSRTNNLMHKFQKCFKNSDLLFVSDIYGASEKPIKNCLEEFFQVIDHPNKQFLPADKFNLTLLKNVSMHDCILFLGAGDINQKAQFFFEEYKQTRQKLKLAILYGGSDFEHEISKHSAKFFFDNIDQENYEILPFFINKEFDVDISFLSKLTSCDVCLPILHGRKGEDGLIQAVLEALKIPFTGCDHFSSSLCMNKAWTKAVCKSNDIDIAKYIHIEDREWRLSRHVILKKINKTFKGPVYIKGCHMGSTIGTKRCFDFSLIEDTIDQVFSFDDELIVEEEVIGRQIEFALWGNDYIHVGEPCEIVVDGVYTYEKKYQDDLANIPVNMDRKLLDFGKEIAVRAYRACGCRGMARVDFFLDQQNKFIFNEINPIPGFTKTSPYYPMLKYLNITENEFINRLIILALHAHRTYGIRKVKC